MPTYTDTDQSSDGLRNYFSVAIANLGIVVGLKRESLHNCTL